jgi:hypothetical protein
MPETAKKVQFSAIIARSSSVLVDRGRPLPLRARRPLLRLREAMESAGVTNLTELARESGVSRPT